MDTKVLRILQELKPHGVGVYVNIAPLLVSLYPPVDVSNGYQVREFWGQILRLLENMKEDGLVLPQVYPSIGSGNQSGGWTWIDNIPVNVSLKQAGSDRLAQEENKGSDERLRESMIETNESIQTTNRLTQQNIGSQQQLTKVALWIAGISAAVALFSLVITIWPKSDKPQVVVLSRTDSILQSTGKKIEAATQTLQRIDSTLKSMKRDSLKKK